MRLTERIALVIAFILMAIIYYQSLIVYSRVPYGFNYSAMLYHFGVFCLLGFSLCLAGFSRLRHIFLVFLVSSSYAALDELHQYFVPGRLCSFGDWMVDLAGIVFGIGVYLATVAIHRSR